MDGTYRQLAASVLVAHQRMDSRSCLCGWDELGKSHAMHVAEVLDAVGALRTTPMTERWKRLALHALSDLDYLGVPIGDIVGVDEEVLRDVGAYQRGQTSYS